MTNGADEKGPVPAEDIAAGVAAVSGEADLATMAARVLEKAQSWAAHSLALCFLADGDAEAGWRMVPELTAGPVPANAGRSLARLIEEAPAGHLAQPVLIRPAEDVPGFKVRDTLVVPWSCGPASGFFVLRGVPRPSPPNLPEAVARLSEPVWPRLAAARGGASAGQGRVERVETLVEEVHRVAERLRAEMRDELGRVRAEVAARAAPAEDATRLAGLEAELAEVLSQSSALRGEVEAVVKMRSAAEADRDALRAQLDQARADADAALHVSRRDVETARADADGARAELESARTAAAEAKTRLVALEAELAAARAAAPAAPAESEEARQRAAELQAKMEALEKARADAEAEREFAKGEAADLQGRLQAVEKLLQEERARTDRGKPEDGDETRRQLAAALEKVAALEQSRLAVEGERDRATVQMNQLWSSIESLQRQVQADKDAFEAEKSTFGERLASLEKAAAAAASERAAAERDRDEALAAFATARERSKQAHEQERALNERWEKASGSFRDALTVLRRTPFLPPTLRITSEELDKILEPEDAARRAEKKAPRVLFLDRDTTAFDALAADLESAGLEVLIAHYPEEVAFFLKTPDSRGLTAIVCDVMAFRPDQNLMDLFRVWRQDQPALGLLLSFKADNPNEAERAQRVPTVLTAGYLPRPLQREALLEAVAGLTRRPAGRR